MQRHGFSSVRGNRSSLTLAKPIAKCGVLYLGSAVPRPDIIGLESIQEPLSKRYPTDNANNVHGINSVLIVRENGVELSFVQDSNNISIFYPIESLVYCASVRFTTISQEPNIVENQQWPFKARWGFVPLDSPFAQLSNSQIHPPLFCSIFKRTRNVAADECHCFITKTKESAIVLVQACFTAFSKQQKLHPDRFHSNCLSGKKVPIYIKAQSHESQWLSEDKSENRWYEIDHTYVRVVEAPTNNPVIDYMTNPNSIGFFYTSINAMIDTWQLWEEKVVDRNSLHQNNQSKSMYSSKAVETDEHGYNSEDYRHTRIKSTTNQPGPANFKYIYSKNNKGSLHSELSSSFESLTDNYGGLTDRYKLPKDLMNDIKKTTEKYGTEIDPYEPAPNLIKVEHKIDPETGANIFVRYFQSTDERRDSKDSQLSVSVQSESQQRHVVPDQQNASLNKVSKNLAPPPKIVSNKSHNVSTLKQDDRTGSDENVNKSTKETEEAQTGQNETAELKGILRKSKKYKTIKANGKPTKVVYDKNAYQITEAYFEDNKDKDIEEDKKKNNKEVIRNKNITEKVKTHSKQPRHMTDDKYLSTTGVSHVSRLKNSQRDDNRFVEQKYRKSKIRMSEVGSSDGKVHSNMNISPRSTEYALRSKSSRSKSAHVPLKCPNQVSLHKNRNVPEHNYQQTPYQLNPYFPVKQPFNFIYNNAKFGNLPSNIYAIQPNIGNMILSAFTPHYIYPSGQKI
ncbi:hypothetical protein GJ496_006507 [Pomphorhynchus laevis]|nr:hypothetical protein GJ496_006507 [Pomphorhynchus laevis]